MDRRKVWLNINQELKAGDTFRTEKVGVVHTSRDKQFDVEATSFKHCVTTLLPTLRPMQIAALMSYLKRVLLSGISAGQA